MNARGANIFVNEAKSKERRIQKFLRKWTNSSAIRAETGKIHSFFSKSHYKKNTYIYMYIYRHAYMMCRYQYIQNTHTQEENYKHSPFQDSRSSSVC